jgi:hypothetical protein
MGDCHTVVPVVNQDGAVRGTGKTHNEIKWVSGY